MRLRLLSAFVLVVLLSGNVWASRLFIPMDATGQTNHLKAYGIAFSAMQQGTKVDWLLNYKGGSFAMEYSADIAAACKQNGVAYTKMSNAQYKHVTREIMEPASGGNVITLNKAPKIAVYTPLNKEPWDDAVTLALTYAGIPFDKIYADEVLNGDLEKYDWLHLHHEDFTGQYGKFFVQFSHTQWYKNDKQTAEALAAKHGFKKVSQMQLAVVKKIKDFVAGGGNMFAMCSATETFDIALAADGVDICDEKTDGDPIDPQAQSKLNFGNCLAFKDFTLPQGVYEYGHSSIDNKNGRSVYKNEDNFNLSVFPAKIDPVPAMLCQNHTTTVKSFMGQTTAFRKETIKPSVLVMGDFKEVNEARYIHGEYEKGTWTFYGGHDPEDYQHFVGNAPTDLSKYPNSPGYRLILNNVLFPAAERKVMPTVVYNDAATSTATRDASTTATKNISLEHSLSIYPNPADNEIIISLSSGKIENVVITTMAGSEVFKQSYSTGKVSINLKDLAPGMYLVQVNGEYAGKVVKE